MITKMKKYLFLVHHAQYEDFLQKLRDVGVLHVALRSQNADNEALRQQLKAASDVENALNEMKPFRTEQSPITFAKTADNALDLIAEFYTQLADLKQVKQKIEQLNNDANRLAVWGDFNRQKLDALADNGCIVQAFSCKKNQFQKAWLDDCNAFIINELGSNCYFVTVNDSPIAIDAEAVALNDKNAAELREEAVLQEGVFNFKQNSLRDWTNQHFDAVSDYYAQLLSRAEWERVLENSTAVADEKVLLLEGYCPDNQTVTLDAMLEENDIFYQSSDPESDDPNVPIKLKNNGFTKMYEVLTKMYGLPDYSEFDPTVMVAPFFTLFVAFCIGDAGYGLVLIALGFLLRKKVKKAMRGVMNLIITLGTATTLLGALFGTFFGVDLTGVDLPQSVQNLMITGKIGETNYDKLMLLSLLIGVVHIVCAMVIKIAVTTRRDGFRNALSAWGWGLFIVGAVAVGALAFFKVLSPELSKWLFIGVSAVAAVGIYLLNNLKRNVFLNIGSGLWDTYNMATGILGDVLSYIRLYALGLAGAMLGGVFNQLAFMAGGACPSWIGWLPCGIILVVGHTLNIAMSCLSAFVHPLRLTFVEYFKNAGYNGKGVAYKPFSHEINNIKK